MHFGGTVISGTTPHSHAVSAIERHAVSDIALRGAYRHAHYHTVNKNIVDIGANASRWKPSQRVALEIAESLAVVKIHGLCPQVQPDDAFREGDGKSDVRYCVCDFQYYTSGACTHGGGIGAYGLMSNAPRECNTFLSIHSLYYLPLQDVFSFIESKSLGGSQSTALFAVLHKFVGNSGTLCNGDLQWWRDMANPQFVTVQVGKTHSVDRHYHNDLSVLFAAPGIGIPYKGGCICVHVDGNVGDTFCLQLRFLKVKPQPCILPVIYSTSNVANLLGARMLYNIPIEEVVVRADARHAYVGIGATTVTIPADWVAANIDFCRYKPRTPVLFADLTRTVTKTLSNSYVDPASRNLITLHLPIVAFTAELEQEIAQLERAQLSDLTRRYNRVIAYLDYLAGENYTIAYHAALTTWKDQPNHTPRVLMILGVLLALLYAAKRVYGLNKLTGLNFASAMSRFAKIARAQIPILTSIRDKVQATAPYLAATQFAQSCSETMNIVAGDLTNRLFLGFTRQAKTLALATLEELFKRVLRPQYSLLFGAFEAFGGNLIDVAYHSIMHFLLRLMPFPVAIAFHTLHNLVHRPLSLSKLQWVGLAIGFACAWMFYRRRRAAAQQSLVDQVRENYLTNHTGTSIPVQFAPGSLKLPATSIDPLPKGSDPLPVPWSPPSGPLSALTTGKVFVENLRVNEGSVTSAPADKISLISEWCAPALLPVVPASDTNTLLASVPRVKTRATTDDDKKFVKTSRVFDWKLTPSAQDVDHHPVSSGFATTSWTGGSVPSPVNWGANVVRSNKWHVVPSAVVYEPNLPPINPHRPVWKGYREFAAAFEISHDSLVASQVAELPCFNLVCIARGKYHTRKQCEEIVRVQLPSAPASLMSGWYWYSCDNHFMTVCMELISSFQTIEKGLVRPPFAPYTYSSSLRAILPHIPYPRVDAKGVDYDRWAVRYTKSKRAALDAARAQMAIGGPVQYTTRCFVKREKNLWAAKEPIIKPPRMINGTSASYNVRFGPYFHALGEQLHERRGPCHMLLEGDYSPILQAFFDGVDFRVFTTGDDCMIIIHLADGRYFVIMLDASRFDGTQNSRVFVLKLLFNMACGMPADMLNDYQYRPLKCRSFVGVDFEADYQCLSGEPGTSVNNSAIMETIGVGILSSCHVYGGQLTLENIHSAVAFWSDAFELNLTTEVATVDANDLVNTMHCVTHCSGWFLACVPTDLRFEDFLSVEAKSYAAFETFCESSPPPVPVHERLIFSNLIGRFVAKTGFTMDAGFLGENHEKIMLATMHSMLATTFHVPIVRVLVYKAVMKYRHHWTPTLIQEFGNQDEFAWKKKSSVISRPTPATFAMCARRYGCTVEDLCLYEKCLFAEPLPIMLGGALVEKLLGVDLSV